MKSCYKKIFAIRNVLFIFQAFEIFLENVKQIKKIHMNSVQGDAERDKSEVGNSGVKMERKERGDDLLVRLSKEALRGKLRVELYEYVRAFTKI